MKFEDIPQDMFCGYFVDCDGCGQEHELRTQWDDKPECHTVVYLPCPCGEYVEFLLPVN